MPALNPTQIMEQLKIKIAAGVRLYTWWGRGISIILFAALSSMEKKSDSGYESPMGFVQLL